MKIVVCPDSFKGTMSAPQAAEAIASGIRLHVPEAEVVGLPLGDGGEGTAVAIASALPGSRKVTCGSVDPLRRPINTSYYIIKGCTALIESAAASGLTLLQPHERDILQADTFGTGLLMVDAYRKGIRDFIVCMGGTATCDAGFGALQALSRVIPPLSSGKPGDLHCSEVRITLLCDVRNPLTGPLGAAAVFGPQKGATPEMVPILDQLLNQRAQEYRLMSGIDVTQQEFAGAAGGLAGMFMACYGANPVVGIDYVLDLLNFKNAIEGADLVVTGEGSADATTLHGKACKGVLDAAYGYGVPVVLLAGRVSDCDLLRKAGFSQVIRATPQDYDPLVPHAEYLKRAVKEISFVNKC